MFIETAKLALRAIRRNLLRSFLTVLGVVIGVAAVIAMVTIGNGTTESVKQELSRLGTNMLFVRPGQFGPGRASTEARRFTLTDVEAITNQISGIQAVAPVNRGSATAVSGGRNHATSVIGTTNDYLIANGWTMALGREFTAAEDRGGLHHRRNHSQRAFWCQQSYRPVYSPQQRFLPNCWRVGQKRPVRHGR
jgi:putative ABC transport system permease protein